MVGRELKLCLIALIALASQTIGAQGLPGEITARQVADASLQAKLDSEAAARAAADAQLQTRINDETAARMRDDAMLDARINAEALTRAQEIAALRGSGGRKRRRHAKRQLQWRRNHRAGTRRWGVANRYQRHLRRAGHN